MSFDVLSQIERDVHSMAALHPGYPLEWARATRVLQHAHAHWTRHANALLANWRLTYMEYLVITSIAATSAALTPRQLADLYGEDLSHMKRVLTKLEARGLLLRHWQENDRRQQVVTITSLGLALKADVVPAVSGLLEHQVQAFGSDNASRLSQLLRGWMRAIRR